MNERRMNGVCLRQTFTELLGAEWIAIDCPWDGMKTPGPCRCVLPPLQVQPSQAPCWPSSSATALSGNPALGSSAVVCPALHCCAQSRVWLLVTPCTVSHQAALSMGILQARTWSGLPGPPPRDLPNPGIEPRSPTSQVDSLPSEPPGKPRVLRKTELGAPGLVTFPVSPYWAEASQRDGPLTFPLLSVFGLSSCPLQSPSFHIPYSNSATELISSH